MLKKPALAQGKIYSLKAIFWCVAILLGAFQAWAHRYNQAVDDVISYLDIGDAYLQGAWGVAINAYWAPLYSWLLSLTLFFLKPSSYWEFPVVKLVNFIIYLFALVCFDFFLRELIFYYKTKISQEAPSNLVGIPTWAWIVSGYALFILTSLQWMSVAIDTPDILVSALVYLANGLLLRIQTRSENWLNFILLGAVLGFSYLSKAVMFPLALVFLAVGLLSVKNIKRALPRVIAALLVFTIIVTPFIIAISTAKGRFTIADTGKLNYVWLVTGGITPYRFWQGNEPGSGTPKHPPRQIFDNPAIFEFGTPIGATYPPWHDPSYWYEGLAFKFKLKNQIKVLVKNISFYYRRFLGGLIFVYLIIVCVSGRFRPSVEDLIENWMLIIPAAAGLCIYMLVIDMPMAFMQTRYIAPFVVVLFAGVLSSVRLPDSQEAKRLIAGLTIITLVVVSSQLFYQTSKDLWAMLRRPEQNVQWQVADGLNHLGVQPGDKIAILGRYIHPYYHWARLARVKIVAEILDEKSFWETDAVVRSKALETIERTGAKVVVEKPRLEITDSVSAIGWQQIGNTDYHAYFFQK